MAADEGSGSRARASGVVPRGGRLVPQGAGRFPLDEEERDR
ncbi:MAG: hypothetical protein KatS3mg014_2400 [Actinomycetota bacterium]|nr:MAG: hypothetical protein KatS3mg014_2400 [Actinomycetota bacterium]